MSAPESTNPIMQGEPAVIDWDTSETAKNACHVASKVATTAMRPGIKLATETLMDKAGYRMPEPVTELIVDGITEKTNKYYETCGDKTISGVCTAVSCVSRKVFNRK